jgi:hypothetical protein
MDKSSGIVATRLATRSALIAAARIGDVPASAATFNRVKCFSSSFRFLFSVPCQSPSAHTRTYGYLASHHRERPKRRRNDTGWTSGDPTPRAKAVPRRLYWSGRGCRSACRPA